MVLQAMQEPCLTCGGDTAGFKCDVCGIESISYDENHVCGGDHHRRKCVECQEAESKCRCMLDKKTP